MIVTVVSAEIYITRLRQEEVLKLTVLDDYEQRRSMFFSPRAEFGFKVLMKQTGVPLVNPRGEVSWRFNHKKLEGKFLSVVERTIDFKDRTATVLDLRRS